jgi:hypothetical protein
MTNLLNKYYVDKILTFSSNRNLLKSGRYISFAETAFDVYTASTDEYKFLEKIKDSPDFNWMFGVYDRTDVENLSIDFIKHFIMVCTDELLDIALNDVKNIKRELVDNVMSNAMKAEMNATKAEMDATKAEMDATKAEMDATKAEMDATKIEMDATKIEMDAMKTEMDAMKTEMDAMKTELESFVLYLT